MKSSFKFVFAKSAENDLIALPLALQKRIFKKFVFYEAQENPLTYAKKLQGTENKFRFRIGDYRIIVSKLSENIMVILLVLKIAHRKDVYDE